MKRVSTSVYIDAEQDAALKHLSGLTKVPAAEYIRQGIDMVIARHRDTVRAFYGDAVLREVNKK